MKVLVTGGAGFIGSEVIRHIINKTNHQVLNYDALTYAGNLESLASISNNERYQFYKGDICNKNDVNSIFNSYKPDVVLHLAAESHVDRSIIDFQSFINTNIVGTSVMLEIAYNYFAESKKNLFKFIHVSTDEVYGSLNDEGLFDENSRYDPSSPYSASKASSDHLVKAWHKTFGLPAIVTNCSNNYGPYQFPEKLIPLMINKALNMEPLPIYGNGLQIRDWLYVEDHAKALMMVAEQGKAGESYNIGGSNEITNLEIVKIICSKLDNLVPLTESAKEKYSISKYEDLISFVDDRPGHDYRYAINSEKISMKLKWQPEETFESGLNKTISWYLNNINWCNTVMSKPNKNQLENFGNLE